MPSAISKLLINYSSPRLLLKYPGLIRVQHGLAWLMTLRFWYVLKVILPVLRKKDPGFMFIDAGCGSGEILFPLIRRFPDAQYYGVDLNENALNTCEKQKQHKKIRNLSLDNIAIEQMKSDKKADVIACVSVLQYLDDPEKGLRNLVRSLKSDGQLIVYLPVNNRRIIPGYKYLRDHWLKGVLYDSYRKTNDLNEKQLRISLSDVGLTIDEIHYVYGVPGKVAFELMSFGQLSILKLPWILAIFFALVYFPIIILPAWILMVVDMLLSHKTGNGLILITSKTNC
ncbi:MAG: class I SAM-dependent methyltransferase [Bacteroidales bacterium]|nr:class I SAM-dependent methyltransferase [Bacteroidales bacterium]